MAGILARVHAELRSRLASTVALALLVGLGSGAVMTMAAGARRTDTAYRRFALAHLAADMQVFPAFGANFAQLDFSKVSHLPQVVASATVHFFGTDDQSLLAMASADPSYGTTINRFKILAGRLPRPDVENEAMISFTLAKNRHVHVGNVLPVTFGVINGPSVTLPLHIVGIEASPGEFPPIIGGTTPGENRGGSIHLSEATYRALVAKRAFTLDFLMMRLKRGGADFAAVNDQLNALANGKPQLNENLDQQAANVQRSIHLQAIALRIVGALIAVIAALVLSQLLARQAAIDATESPTLMALGMTRSQVWASGMAKAATIGVLGAAVGVAAASLASPVMPIGTARTAAGTGFSVDPLVLSLSAVVAVALVCLLAAWPIWRNARTVGRDGRTPTPARPSVAARLSAVPGFPPSVASGMRLALESGRGRTEVPVRSSMASVILAIVALAGALTFGASLNHLLATPRLYGWNWDAHLTTNGDVQNVDEPLKLFSGDPRITDVATVDTPPVTLGRAEFDVIGLDSKKGLIQPVIINGRAPRTADEVALGVKTLRDAHLRIGDTVPLGIAAIQGPKAPFHIVGTVIVPPNSDTARLGSGAALLYQGEKRMVPPDFKNLPPITDLYLTFAAGVNGRHVIGDYQRRFGDEYVFLLPQRPTDLINFGQVQNLPLLLAGLVSLLAAATLAHTLVTSIRRRRRDLAILKMLGFVPSQVRWAVAWQATTFVSAALVIGLPIGIAIGRVVWNVFATNLGTLPEAVTPSLPLLLTIPGAIVIANVIAIVPGVLAGRMHPAPVLRAE